MGKYRRISSESCAYVEWMGTIAALAASPDKCAAHVERRAAAPASCDAASYWAETAPIAPEVAQDGKRAG